MKGFIETGALVVAGVVILAAMFTGAYLSTPEEDGLTFGAASAPLRASGGGTGISSSTPSDVGNCLSVSDDDPFTWTISTCGSGGGGSGGTWSTTTSETSSLINYPNNTSDIVVIGSNATTTGEFYFDPNTQRAFFLDIADFTTSSSTILTDFQVNGNSTTTGAAYFSSGLISNASSSFSGDFFLTGAATTTGSIYSTDSASSTFTGGLIASALSATDAAATSTLAGGLVIDGSLRLRNLLNCDTIDTDATGQLRCGSDDAGAGGTGSNWTYVTDSNGDYLKPSTTVGLITSASSTFVSGVSFADVTLFAGALDASSTAAFDGLTVDNLTSALTLAGSSGIIGEYTGTTCTNQFVRSLDAVGAATCATVVAGDVSLANLTATDASLTFSGTYNGSTARTIGLNVGNANSWTASQSFADVSFFTGAIDASTTAAFDGITVDAAGRIGTTLGVASSTPGGIFSVGDGATQATSTYGGPIIVDDPTHVGTSTHYIHSGTADFGGEVIVEDVDGAGCTSIAALDGTLISKTVTCPTYTF